MRPGPGKFEGNDDARIAVALHRILGDGAEDASAGDCSEVGVWYGLIRRTNPDLGGYIVEEDDQGFFTYTTYDTRESLDAAWAEVEEWEAERYKESD